MQNILYMINQYTHYGIWNDLSSSFKKSGSDSEDNDNWVLLSTGATDRNSILNIYDLAGNLSEWTLQFSGDLENPCLNRGGNFSHYSSSRPMACYGNNYPIDKSSVDFGFRTTLY